MPHKHLSYPVPVPSLLDRLAEDADAARMIPAYTVDDSMSNLARDLRDLFNTRRTVRGNSEMIDRTVVGYGLPDLGQLSHGNPEHRAYLRAELLRAIDRFEPRLHDVQVEEMLDHDALEARLTFRISALYTVEMTMVPVVLETRFNTSDDRIRVDPVDGMWS